MDSSSDKHRAIGHHQDAEIEDVRKVLCHCVRVRMCVCVCVSECECEYVCIVCVCECECERECEDVCIVCVCVHVVKVDQYRGMSKLATAG